MWHCPHLARYIQAPAALSAIGKHNLQQTGQAERGRYATLTRRSAISATVRMQGELQAELLRRRTQGASTDTADDTGCVRASEAVLRGIRQPPVQQSIGMHDTAGQHCQG